ncbi:TM2 domain-containing protein [Mycoplasmopsis lipofaciens]|uniref:TM2 domain-containing protein n=1 Tax=Mycoplasmopsis lipofaciens TaxID=114884 RepID=UPI000482A771|nr:TM2 domain-containing protein [Mycoplasmopsis lipofaciens]
MKSTKSRTALVLLSFFLGFLGVDRFYAGRVLLGIFKLLTGGGILLWLLIDFILAVVGKMKDSTGAFISEW